MAAGSGKPTVTALLPRFYDVIEGVIRIDGIDVLNRSRWVAAAVQDEDMTKGRPNQPQRRRLCTARSDGEGRGDDAIVTAQPGSETDRVMTARVMTAVACYAGLRPPGVVMPRLRTAESPAPGWGRLAVTETDIFFDQPGEPKTGPRSVPIPPELVAMQRAWVRENDLTALERVLFRLRNDTIPSGSNWARA